MHSAIYSGLVVHQRTRPKRHRLTYRVFTLLLDLDELAPLDRKLKLFGVDRAAALSFHEADHGDGVGGDLRAWVDRQLAALGLSLPGGRVEMLCYPRMFGFVFNPLTVYFCTDAAGALRAILYEVANTHGERHTYVIPVPTGHAGTLRQSAPKRFFVSPFIEMNVQYDFAIAPPGETVRIGVTDRDEEGTLLTATFAGHRRELTDRALLGALVRYPLMTLKVVAGIHWEALLLWLKRVPVVPYARAEQKSGRTVVTTAPLPKEHLPDVAD